VPSARSFQACVAAWASVGDSGLTMYEAANVRHRYMPQAFRQSLPVPGTSR
jgi:hypothetical protein